MDAKDVTVYIGIGQTLFAIGKGALDSIKGALKAADVDADNAQLDKVDAAYSDRIAQAEAEAAKG